MSDSFKFELPPAKKPASKKKTVMPIVSNVLFYGALLGILFGVFAATAKDDRPHDIFGYSYFTVLSKSMQSEIPKGSFVVTKRTEPTELKTGDDITFFKDFNTTITHRVIEIHENYNGSGERGFKTQGIENDEPDEVIVSAGNIVGKVVFHIPKAGEIMKNIAKNIWFIIAALALLMIFGISLRVYIKESKKPPHKEKSKKI